MIIDRENRTILFRQSWLDTAFRCPEEARYAIVKPEYDQVSSDEAIIGTGAHKGIEAVIDGTATPAEIGYHAEAEVRRVVAEEGIKWTKRTRIEEVIDYAVRCAEAWVRDLMPNPIFNLNGARTEQTFKVFLCEYRGWKLYLTGTIDVVPPVNELADWKTSSSEYKQHEKQRWAIQPTIYTLAAVKGGLQTDGWPVEYRWPMLFHYGVMVKRVGPCRGQVVTVMRTEAHAAWAERRIKTFVDLFLDFGLDKSWPQVDEKNYLCSPTWCAWYSLCRGTEITPAMDRWSAAA